VAGEAFLDELGFVFCPVSLVMGSIGGGVFPPCPRIDDGMFQSDDQRRTKDGREYGIPSLKDPLWNSGFK